MQHSDFTIGLQFWCSERQWRCTDVGSRVIVAMRVDAVEVTCKSESGETRRVLTTAQAEAEGWFNGPPYAVAEAVFDEYDFEGCTVERDA